MRYRKRSPSCHWQPSVTIRMKTTLMAEERVGKAVGLGWHWVVNGIIPGTLSTSWSQFKEFTSLSLLIAYSTLNEGFYNCLDTSSLLKKDKKIYSKYPDFSWLISFIFLCIRSLNIYIFVIEITLNKSCSLSIEAENLTQPLLKKTVTLLPMPMHMKDS